jgi:hypothetical protein
MKMSGDDYPHCPSCDSDWMVVGYAGLEDYECLTCEIQFDATGSHDGRQQEVRADD